MNIIPEMINLPTMQKNADLRNKPRMWPRSSADRIISGRTGSRKNCVLKDSNKIFKASGEI
jgi:hypothetical protein